MSNRSPADLVCCVVMSYNSSDTIIYTLDSIISQNLIPHRLIITDDASTDSSRSVIRKWLCINESYFAFTELIFPDTRLGTNNILSDALHYVEEPFIKAIAGDDILCPGYFKESLTIFEKHNPDVILSTVDFIDSLGNVLNSIESNTFLNFNILMYLGRFTRRYFILHQMFIPSVGAIFKTSTLRNVRSSEFFLIEDWPMWINLLWGRYTIYFSHRLTVQYRIHPTQITKKVLDPQSQIWIYSDRSNINQLVSNTLSHSSNFFRLFFFLDHFTARLVSNILDILGFRTSCFTSLISSLIVLSARLLNRIVDLNIQMTSKFLH
jgi:glycosyltransferase involved in cell wall biosynthesis